MWGFFIYLNNMGFKFIMLLIKDKGFEFQNGV
jgi:hypothetical protein